MEALNRTFAIWAIGVFAATPLALRWLRFDWPQIGLSSVLQLLVVGFLAGALPNMDAGMQDRSRQKRTMADMRSLAEAIESCKASTGAFPHAESVQVLQTMTRRRLPLHDAWGNAFTVSSTERGYTIVSYGACGERDLSIQPGAVSPRGDLVLRDGRFVTFAAGYEP